MSASGSVSTDETPVDNAAGFSAGVDELIVRRVYERCAAAIARAVAGTAVRVDFLGALTANESGGDPDAAHFERWIYQRLYEVAAAREQAFGSIGRAQLAAFLRANAAAEISDGEPVAVSAQMEQAIRKLSTSWGYTQIMGYQVIGRGERTAALLDPAFHFHLAVELLAGFARRFQLRLDGDFEALFRCWNTGRPDGETFNPDYVPMGLRRCALYRDLMADRPATESGTEGQK